MSAHPNEMTPALRFKWAMISKTSESLDWGAIVMSLTTDTVEPCNEENNWKSDGRLIYIRGGTKR
jgi:hypothetical protein